VVYKSDNMTIASLVLHVSDHLSVQEMRKRRQGGGSSDQLGVMNRKDILYPGSLLNIPEYK
jgi:hypothetical protein